MMLLAVGRVQSSRDLERSNEQGWALLGLLLALGVMSIIFTSSIIPNVQMQVQRDKEIEMIYRGEQMAEGIFGRRERVTTGCRRATIAASGELSGIDESEKGHGAHDVWCDGRSRIDI